MIQTTYTFRKKPIEIQAWHWRFSTEQAEEPVWIRDALHRWPQLGSIAFEPHHPDGPRIAIATLEGVMTANPGDWIIRGVKGEIYPCKPDIFEMTYERADAPSDRDALVAALAQAEHERDEARRERDAALDREAGTADALEEARDNARHIRNLHDWRIRDLQDVRADRDFLRERAERAERQRDQAIEALRLLTDWASRMPDAGFTDSDPRWGWWHSPVRAAARDVLAAIEKDAA